VRLSCVSEGKKIDNIFHLLNMKMCGSHAYQRGKRLKSVLRSVIKEPNILPDTITFT
jgi:hypothetical protein